jgi:outer membrane protein assembly factor BamB
VSLFLPVNDPSGLFALDLATGRPAWSFAAARDWGAHPTVAGRVVLAGDLGGRLRALDRVTGGLAWEFQAPNGIDAGAAVRGGDAFVADCSGRLRRLDLRTGRAAWTFETPRERRGNRTVGGTPLVTDGAVAFGSGDGFVYCLDPGTGAPRWELEPAADSEVAATLCPGGGRLFAAVRKCGFPRPRGRGIDAIVATGEAP